tara:strand:+ start:123 stop:293 length:171 start_codon:yes stop_codon:yes gene_type:complete
MIRIIKDGEVIKETLDMQTLVQFIDFYDSEPKAIEFSLNYDEIEKRNERQAAELSD